MFLLCIGPVVLKQHLDKAHYENFICFSVAASGLLSETKKEKAEYARQLLICFVQQAAKLYGKAFIVCNVHSMILAADDVLHHYTCSTI